MSLPKNPFTTSETAEAYARGRPYFHPLIAEKVREKLGLAEPVEVAVDVACGTGLSTRALLTLAKRVVATDISEAMLWQAPKDERISYHRAAAESLPLADASADLITVSSAFHWLERGAFLQEVQRVLRPGGWLVIYENFFRGPQPPKADFAAWLQNYYEAHPSPPRDQAPFADEDAREAGFEFVARESYENIWSFELADFVSYLTSQSNAVAAVARGGSSAGLRLKLSKELEPFFDGEETFIFAGFIWILRRDTRHA